MGRINDREKAINCSKIASLLLETNNVRPQAEINRKNLVHFISDALKRFKLCS